MASIEISHSLRRMRINQQQRGIGVQRVVVRARTTSKNTTSRVEPSMSKTDSSANNARTSRRAVIGGAMSASLATKAADALALESIIPLDYTPSFGPLGLADIPDYLSPGPFRTSSVERQKHAYEPLCPYNVLSGGTALSRRRSLGLRQISLRNLLVSF
eukprot:3103452-Pyramimonas_sp.AAC.1